MDDKEVELHVKTLAALAQASMPTARLIIVAVTPTGEVTSDGSTISAVTWETPGMDDDEVELRLGQLSGVYFDKRRAALKEAANG